MSPRSPKTAVEKELAELKDVCRQLDKMDELTLRKVELFKTLRSRCTNCDHTSPHTRKPTKDAPADEERIPCGCGCVEFEPVTQARIGAAAGMSDVGVVLAIQRHDARMARTEAKAAAASTG